MGFSCSFKASKQYTVDFAGILELTADARWSTKVRERKIKFTTHTNGID